MASLAKVAKNQFVSSYVSALRSKVGYYLPYVPNEYADQVEADNFYEVLRKDPEITRCLNLLAVSAGGEKVSVECENKKKQEIAKHSVSHIKDFMLARKSLIEKSVLFGLGVQRKIYKYIYTKQGLKLRVVCKLQEVDRRRMRWERDTEDKNKIYKTIWHPLYDQYIILEDRAKNPFAPDGCAFQDYVWYVQMEEEVSPYYEGYGEVLYDLCYIKSKVWQYWADLSESWAKPLMVAIMDLSASAINAQLGSGYKDANSRAMKLLDTLEKTRARHNMVFSKGDEVKLFEHGSTGNNILKDLIEAINKQIDLVILGSELSTTTSGKGSFALGSIHREALDTVILYNRFRCAETLEREIIDEFFVNNAMQLAQIGIRQPEDGEIKLKLDAEMTDLQKEQAGEQEFKNKDNLRKQGVEEVIDQEVAANDNEI